MFNLHRKLTGEVPFVYAKGGGASGPTKRQIAANDNANRRTMANLDAEYKHRGDVKSYDRNYSKYTEKRDVANELRSRSGMNALTSYGGDVGKQFASSSKADTTDSKNTKMHTAYDEQVFNKQYFSNKNLRTHQEAEEKGRGKGAKHTTGALWKDHKTEADYKDWINPAAQKADKDAAQRQHNGDYQAKGNGSSKEDRHKGWQDALKAENAGIDSSNLRIGDSYGDAGEIKQAQETAHNKAQAGKSETQLKQERYDAAHSDAGYGPKKQSSDDMYTSQRNQEYLEARSKYKRDSYTKASDKLKTQREQWGNQEFEQTKDAGVLNKKGFKKKTRGAGAPSGEGAMLKDGEENLLGG